MTRFLANFQPWIERERMRERMRKREKERLTKKGDKSEKDEEMGSRENIYLHL